MFTDERRISSFRIASINLLMLFAYRFALLLSGTRNFFSQVTDDASPICVFLDLNTE